MENLSYYDADGKGVIYDHDNDTFFTFENGKKVNLEKEAMTASEKVSFKWFENLYPEIVEALFSNLESL